MSGLRELVADVHDGQWVGGMRWDYAALLAGFRPTLCPTAEKAAHATAAAAHLELDRLVARRKAKGRPAVPGSLVVYACRCGAHHIGNRSGRELGAPIPTPRRSHP